MQRREFLKGVFGTVLGATVPLPLVKKTVPHKQIVHDCFLLLSTKDEWLEIDKLDDMTLGELSDFGFDKGIEFNFRLEQINERE